MQHAVDMHVAVLLQIGNTVIEFSCLGYVTYRGYASKMAGGARVDQSNENQMIECKVIETFEKDCIRMWKLKMKKKIVTWFISV